MFIVPKEADQPTRVVFDFNKATQAHFRIAMARQAEEARLEKTKASKKQDALASKKADAPRRGRRWRIVVDPGHGGKDGGAKTRKGVLEKEIVLSFAEHLATALSGSGRFDVILTRTSDKFVPLKERVDIARANDADLFISIHSDSFPRDRRVRGTAVYTMKGKIRFFKVPLQRGAFTVLRVPDIPSALIELGFLSNNADAELLSSPAWRERIALEMAGTIASYFKVPLSGLGE